MSHILDPTKFVQPYIGSKFDSAKIKYILIGESNYSDSRMLDTDHLRNMTHRYADPEDSFTYKFWTNIMQTLSGKHKKEMGEQKVVDFWDKVILHNYVCDLHGRDRGVRIPNSAWEMSREPFKIISSNYSPDLIVFFSKAARNDLQNIPNLAIRQIEKTMVGVTGIRYVEKFTITLSGVVIQAISLPHPSWFYNFKRYIKFFDATVFD